LWGIACNFGYCDPTVTGRRPNLDIQIGRNQEAIGKYRLLTIFGRRSTPKQVLDDASQSAKLLGFREPT
jgi:hypothetical protein